MCHLRAWLGIVWCSAYTCKLNDIDPLTWLTDVLERIVSGRTKNHQLHELLPWVWKAARAAQPLQAAA